MNDERRTIVLDGATYDICEASSIDENGNWAEYLALVDIDSMLMGHDPYVGFEPSDYDHWIDTEGRPRFFPDSTSAFYVDHPAGSGMLGSQFFQPPRSGLRHPGVKWPWQLHMSESQRRVYGLKQRVAELERMAVLNDRVGFTTESAHLRHEAVRLQHEAAQREAGTWNPPKPKPIEIRSLSQEELDEFHREVELALDEDEDELEEFAFGLFRDGR